MRDALTAALRREGLCISTAANGVEALEKVQAQSFDLIVTDVRMPRMGGLALLQELKRTSPSIPVIMMTGYGRIEDAVEAMKAGALDYLLKPFSLEDLKAVVIKALTPSHTPARPPVEHARRGHDFLEAGGTSSDPSSLLIRGCCRSSTWQRNRHLVATVLIQGESGTGKEVLARHIHANSPRDMQPFVAVNCAAIPEGLSRVNYSATRKVPLPEPSRNKLANSNGPIVALSYSTKSAKCLPYKRSYSELQEHEIERVGARKPIPVDLRIIATTTSFEGSHGSGKFREDLYYRLNVIPLNIPPLESAKAIFLC